MVKSSRIKLMAEVQCWALWDIDHPDNIDPDSLPISKGLVNELNNWSDRFDALYKLDDPSFDGNVNFSSNEEETQFYEDGWLLLEQLKSELPGVKLWYRDGRYNELLKEQPE